MSKTKQPKLHSEGACKGRSANADGTAIRQIRQPLHRPVLLVGTSALALMLMMPVAHARPIGSAGQNFSAATNAATSAITSAQQAAAATQQSMQSLTRATQAIQAIQAMQAMQNAQCRAVGSEQSGG
jgi:hypothetical protein